VPTGTLMPFRFSTVGVDQNILASSIQALEKGFNYYLLKSQDFNKTKKGVPRGAVDGGDDGI